MAALQHCSTWSALMPRPCDAPCVVQLFPSPFKSGSPSTPRVFPSQLGYLLIKMRNGQRSLVNVQQTDGPLHMISGSMYHRHKNRVVRHAANLPPRDSNSRLLWHAAACCLLLVFALYMGVRIRDCTLKMACGSNPNIRSCTHGETLKWLHQPCNLMQSQHPQSMEGSKAT